MIVLRAVARASLPHSRCVRCFATPSGGDEGRAFKIDQHNRRKPLTTPSGPSKDLITSMAELSKGQAAVNSTKTVFGTDQLSWKEVDEAVNQYPCERQFTAIGDASGDFAAAMVDIVELELSCRVHEEAILVRPSKTGKYVSVKIGPVVIRQPDQVIAIYSKMKSDQRLKWFL